jgi:hypothetical protein
MAGERGEELAKVDPEFGAVGISSIIDQSSDGCSL